MAQRSHFDFNLFRAMEVFLAIVETRHITRAAGLLGITQSAASQQLRSLEEAFGTRLLDRQTRPIELTPAGMSLHRRARRVMDEIDDLANDVRRLDTAPIPLLRVGLLASIATTLTAPLAALARATFGVPETAFHAGLASEHTTLLRTRRADMVIISDALYDLGGLERHGILTEQFLLVLPAGWREPVEDLAVLARRLPLVRFSTETPVGRLTEQHLRRVRLELPRVLEADRSSMVMSLVATGRGFALMTPMLLIDGLNERMAAEIRPLPIPGFTRRITLLARANELGAMPRAFAAESRKALRTALAGHHDPRIANAVRFAEPDDATA